VRAIIYSRISTGDQHVENQVEQLKEYVQRQNWELFEVICDVASGGKTVEERKGLQRVFKLASQRKFEVLVFWALDRFSRCGSRQVLQDLETLNSYSVKWVSFTEMYISSLGPFSECIIALLATLAKQERLRIGERVRLGLQRVKKSGKRLGREPMDMKRVEEAKQLRAQNLSYSQIAKKMNVTPGRAYQIVNYYDKPFNHQKK